MRKFFGAAGALALVIGGAGAAGAGEVAIEFDPTLTLTPTSGPAGSTFAVSGSDCVDQDGGDMTVEVTALDTVETTAETTPDGAGDWSVDLTVPDDAVEGDTISVDATCVEDFSAIPAGNFQSFRAPSGKSITQDYDQATFTVTASPTTVPEDPPTTVEDTTTTSTTEPDGEVDAADAAAPTVAEPTFTG